MPQDLEARLRRRQSRLDHLTRSFILGPRHGAYRWFTAAWAIAVAARLTLAESLQASWVVPSLLLVLGALGLLRWGGRIFWLLSAVGLALPLGFLGDWLTQTVVMLLVALVGGLTVRSDDGATVLSAASWLTLLTYAIAAFHKLNSGFFDPAISCANHTWSELASFLPGLSLPSEAPFAAALPVVAVCLELTVAALLVWLRRVGYFVGIIFHVPLTLVLAPAFVFVMLTGYAALSRPSDRALCVDLIERHPIAIGVAVVLLTGGLWLSMGELPAADAGAKHIFLFFLLVVTGAMAFSRSPAAPDVGRLPAAGIGRWAVAGAVCLYLANGLTPYLGTQVQHTGAMLSNLRIDSGCWNHLVVPESVRRVDSYVRIEQAEIGTPRGAYADAESLLIGRLWSAGALRRIRRNWCSPRSRPIALWGSHRGAPFAIVDLCDPDVQLPTDVGVFGGPALFPDYLRFQKHLERECSQQCIH